ncbi:hypothetical protein Y032_0766g2173 [Ancylostoma ceylanicum]|nr:hypothetical protein Y032_0766g2173 [Ancylostoma ceylanicum]
MLYLIRKNSELRTGMASTRRQSHDCTSIDTAIAMSEASGSRKLQLTVSTWRWLFCGLKKHAARPRRLRRNPLQDNKLWGVLDS